MLVRVKVHVKIVKNRRIKVTENMYSLHRILHTKKTDHILHLEKELPTIRKCPRIRTRIYKILSSARMYDFLEGEKWYLATMNHFSKINSVIGLPYVRIWFLITKNLDDWVPDMTGNVTSPLQYHVFVKIVKNFLLEYTFFFIAWGVILLAHN